MASSQSTSAANTTTTYTTSSPATSTPLTEIELYQFTSSNPSSNTSPVQSRITSPSNSLSGSDSKSHLDQNTTKSGPQVSPNSGPPSYINTKSPYYPHNADSLLTIQRKILHTVLEFNQVLFSICLQYGNQGWKENPEYEDYEKHLKSNLAFLASSADQYLSRGKGVIKPPPELPLLTPLPSPQIPDGAKASGILERLVLLFQFQKKMVDSELQNLGKTPIPSQVLQSQQAMGYSQTPLTTTTPPSNPVPQSMVASSEALPKVTGVTQPQPGQIPLTPSVLSPGEMTALQDALPVQSLPGSFNPQQLQELEFLQLQQQQQKQIQPYHSSLQPSPLQQTQLPNYQPSTSNSQTYSSLSGFPQK